jgi:hypothetical protein
MVKAANLNIFVFMSALLLALASLILVTPRASRADSLGDEVRQFQHFLHEHPRIGGELRRDPGLATSSHYLNNHDNLRQFLRNHPGLRRELAVNPGRVLNNSYAWDNYGYDNNRRYDNRRYDNDRRNDNHRYDNDRRNDSRRYDKTRPYGWWGWGRR